MYLASRHKQALKVMNERTLFSGPSPAKSPRKQGHNRPVPAPRFAALSPEQLTIRFADHTVTQVGGYPLWDRFLRRPKLNTKLAQHLKMDRGPMGFTAPELSRFFIDSRLLRSDRLMHVDPLRYDPMLAQSYGLGGLPSDGTLGGCFKGRCGSTSGPNAPPTCAGGLPPPCYSSWPAHEQLTSPPPASLAHG